ncbi:MAG: nickel-responsive transcriptional regulator NikR [candidate division Zixibacteria bacterium]|nr:nickel-responsive transcriptional regulator NikR [candidate division Zixibacteria bacterium]
MSKLVRFGVSLDGKLLQRFDENIRRKGYPTRSKALADLIYNSLVQRDRLEGREVVGTISLVYDHRKRELMSRLTRVQHQFHHQIISSQHVHLDRHNCLEIIIARGKAAEIEKLNSRLRAIKGVKHASVNIATAG